MHSNLLNMKKLINAEILTCYIILLLFNFSFAQVGIGTTSPADGALLDLNSANKGLLVPRVSIADLSTILPITPGTASGTSGILVWNTNGTTGVGFHYWDGNDWIPLLGGAPSVDWTILGNAGTDGGANATTSGINFIGTTDLQRLKFRTNDTERMEILSTGEVQVGALAEADPFPGDTFTSRGDEYPINAWGDGNSALGLLSSAIYASQDGNGALFFGQHNSDTNAGMVIQMEDYDNTDDGIRVLHNGGGTAITAQTQDVNVLGFGPILVADFAYTGLDVDDHIGVMGQSITISPWFGIGAEGHGNWYGIHGIQTGNGYGVFSTGDSGATGTKFFAIDHPLDPANKFLRHASIESNEILNLYRGTDLFDSSGKATISLPKYFDAININPSYQLTAIGAAMPNLYIERELENGVFVIAGGIPGKKVSWQVTAERNDPYLQQNPNNRIMEFDKGPKKGKYLMPHLFNQPEESRIGFSKNRTIKKLDKKNVKKD